MGVARGGPQWWLDYRRHTQPGHAADGRQNSGARLRCVGACVLPQVSEPQAGLRGGMVERGELDRRLAALRQGSEPRDGATVTVQSGTLPAVGTRAPDFTLPSTSGV